MARMPPPRERNGSRNAPPPPMRGARNGTRNARNGNNRRNGNGNNNGRAPFPGAAARFNGRTPPRRRS